ncbi:hypothetical protein V2I01_04725 [Micromonospora sp. BRA006-A]|nr:hypothetical protein [Micromonospora sp. BRA006-A]
MRIMLAGAHLVAAARFDDMLLDDLEGFTPTDDRPGLIIVIDECHRFFCHDDIQELAANLITEYRKVGITIIAATQSGNLDRAFGTGKHADVLRSALLTGNGVVLRIKSGSIKDVLKLAYDPRDFPPIPGYARMVDEERGRRSAASGSPTSRSRRCRSECGGAASARRKVRRSVRATPTGRVCGEGEGGRTAAAAGTAGGCPHSGARPDLRRRAPAAPQAQAVAELLEDVVFPVWPGSVEPEFEPTDSHRKVLDAIGAGRQQPKDAMEAAGIGSSRFYKLAGICSPTATW